MTKVEDKRRSSSACRPVDIYIKIKCTEWYSGVLRNLDFNDIADLLLVGPIDHSMDWNPTFISLTLKQRHVSGVRQKVNIIL
jgi:hypothetical protein